jgi:cob(I)alamin adenosyltransferase
MPRITRVTTRTGDGGDTALATGRRLRKDHPRIEAYGTVDELSSLLGVALSCGVGAELAEILAGVQNDLFHLGAELATPVEESGERRGPGIEGRHVERLETWQERLNGELPPLANFVLPGGAPAAAHLQVGRTVCRRAERRVVALAAEESVSAEAVRYLNRLSDLLFTMARWENQQRGVEQPVWDSRA